MRANVQSPVTQRPEREHVSFPLQSLGLSHELLERHKPLTESQE